MTSVCNSGFLSLFLLVPGSVDDTHFSESDSIGVRYKTILGYAFLTAGVGQQHIFKRTG